MDIFQLQLFSLVVRYNSLSKAAEEMSITQPAASQSIARLESELGCKLFIREKRRIYLNREGKLFHKHAINILKEMDIAVQEISENSGKVAGMLHLQVFAASALVPKLLFDFMAAYPEVQFHMVQQLNLEEYDICINATIDPALPPNSELLFEEEIMLAVPHTHRLAVCESINLSETKDEHYIMLRKGSALRAIANHFCNQAGFEPQVHFEADNPSLLREIISMGLGVAFLPRISWKSVIDERIKLLRITDMHCSRKIYLHVPSGRISSNTVATFKEYALSYFKNTAESVICEAQPK